MPELIPEHIKYWNRIKPEGYSGGPFGDHTGGLILFKTENIEIARQIADNDPFITGGGIEKSWVKEWVLK